MFEAHFGLNCLQNPVVSSNYYYANARFFLVTSMKSEQVNLTVYIAVVAGCFLGNFLIILP